MKLQLSQFSHSLLASFVFMAALVPILMSTALTDNSGEFYSALLIHEMIVILIGVSIVVSAILVRDMYDPLWFAQKNFRRPTVDIESVVDGFHELCDQLKLKVRPKGVVTDLASEPFSFGVHQGNSIVVLPRGVLGLDNVERKAVIVHELWHINTDVETAYHKKIRKTLALGLLFVSMISILVVIYEHDALGWWNKKLVVSTCDWQGICPTLTFELFALNALWLLAFALVFPAVFFLLSNSLIAVFGYPPFLRRDHREYIADGIASIFVSPQAVAMAANHLKEGERDLWRGARSWKQVFDSRFTGGKHIPFGYRICNLFLMENFLHGSVKLSWRHSLRNRWEGLLTSLVFRTSFLLFGNMFRMRSEVFWRIAEYMDAHKQQFNMVECARETQSSIVEVYSTWYLLCVYAERVQIVEPQYDRKRILNEMIKGLI